MLTEDERIDLGGGFAAVIQRDAHGREVAIQVDHRTVSGTRCRARYVLEAGRQDASDRASLVRIEQRDPLTLDRPLGCARCGTVGWVVEGHWSDHGRRRSMRRHPTTTWSRGAEHAATVEIRPADPDRFVTEWISS